MKGGHGPTKECSSCTDNYLLSKLLLTIALQEATITLSHFYCTLTYFDLYQRNCNSTILFIHLTFSVTDDKYRVHLEPKANSVDRGDYINASFVDVSSSVANSSTNKA